MHTEWRKSHEFAPFAEALGIDTSQILAVIVDPAVIVLYTESFEDADSIWSARLDRDADDILVRVGEPHRTAQTWGDLRDAIDAGLAKLDEELDT